jgi:delta24-sterol reductase
MASGPRPPSAYMQFVEKHRAWLVCIGVLPASVVLKFVEKAHRWLTAPRPEGHEERVRGVCAAVQQWASLPAAERKPMCTDRSSSHSHSVRLADKSQWHKIRLGQLRAILGVEGEGTAAVVRVEPGVTVSEITLYLLERGLQLACTLEMEDATLGGLAAATGMTTHSHVCGLIHDTIEAWEVVTAAGEVVTATATNAHADLFHALPFSHGSLGLIVGLTLRCEPARPYVRLTYTPFTSQTAFTKRYEAVVRRGAEESGNGAAPFYAEAILFSADRAVLMEGHLTDAPSAEAPLHNIGRWWKPWFYTRVREVLLLGAREAEGGGAGVGASVTETVPVYDYLMRHDRSMCMTMETVMPFGNDAWFRFPFGWTLPPKMSLLKASHNDETREASVRRQVYQVRCPLHRSTDTEGPMPPSTLNPKPSDPSILLPSALGLTCLRLATGAQDIAFPCAKLSEAVEICERLFNIYPLLCYPCRVRDVPGRMVRTGTGVDEPYFNLGVYGVPEAVRQGRPFKTVTAVRELEQWVRGARGFQHTYCDSFMTRDEFEQMFDMRPNAALRARYGAEGAFVGVYEKTRPEVPIWAWKAEEDGWAM